MVVPRGYWSVAQLTHNLQWIIKKKKKIKSLSFSAWKKFLPDSTFLQGLYSKVFQRTSLAFCSLSFIHYHSNAVVVFFHGRIFPCCSRSPPRSPSSQPSKEITHNALLRWVHPCVKCLFIGRAARLCSSVALILAPCRQIYFAALFEIEIKVWRRVKKKKGKRSPLAVPVTNLFALSCTQTQTHSCFLPLVAKLTSSAQPAAVCTVFFSFQCSSMLNIPI